MKHHFLRIAFLLACALWVPSLHAQTVVYDHGDSATASGAGASGKPSLTFNVTAGMNRVIFVTASFERDHCTTVTSETTPNCTSDTGSTNRNFAGPTVVANNGSDVQIQFTLTGPGGALTVTNPLAAPAGDLRFSIRAQASNGSGNGYSSPAYSSENYYTAVYEAQIRSLLGGASTGQVTITLPNVQNPRRAGDEGLLSAIQFNNVNQLATGAAGTGIVRSLSTTPNTDCLTGADISAGTAAANWAICMGAAYDTGQAPVAAGDAVLLFGFSGNARTATRGFQTAAGFTEMMSPFVTNNDPSGGNFRTGIESDGFSTSYQFRNGTPTAGMLMQSRNAAGPTTGGNAAGFTLRLAPLNLSITKSDGVTSILPGASTTYAVVVANNPAATAPNYADGAVVTDPASASLTKTAVSCTASGGAVCPVGLTIAMLESGATIPTFPPNSSLTFSVTATVATAATGSVSNTATVATPAGYTDTNPANNTATDTNTITARPRVTLRKISQGGVGSFAFSGTNGVATQTLTTVTAGTPVAGTQMVLTAQNTTTDITEGDPAGAGFVLTAASCTGTANGGTGTFDAGLRRLRLTAAEVGTNADITCTFTNASSTADLSITKTDGRSTYAPGQPLTYTIVARNNGPAAVTGARVTDIFPASITDVAWTCGAGTNGGTCGSASGSGNLNNAVVNLPSGATVTFTATGTVAAGTSGNISNTATITGPASGGPTDPDTSNNSATDIDGYAPLAPLTCAANEAFVLAGGTNIYRVDATGGAGSPTLVVTLPRAPTGLAWNGMGVSVASNTVYVTTNEGTPAGQVLAYNLTTGTSVLTAVPSVLDTSIGFVAGGVSPLNGWFYIAAPVASGAANTSFVLYAYNPATGSAAPVRVGTITGVAGASGDLAFDAQGNLYLLAGNLSGATPRIYRVDAAAVLAGSGAGSALPATAIAPPFTSATRNFAGLAFANGEILAAGGSDYQRFNPSNGALIGAFTGPGVMDLAACDLPNTVRLQKTLPDGRVTAGDQFTLSITGGGLASGNTAVTTSTGTGAQTPIVGPLLGLGGTTFTLTETAPDLAAYNASWQCINTAAGNASVGSGTGSSGSFVMPAGAGHDILCTFTNTQATRLTLQKTWADAQANDAVTISVTQPAGVGVPLNAVADSGSETDTGTPFNIARGSTYTLTEAFTAGVGAQYARNLVCTGNTGTGAATTYVPDALSGTVTVGSTATNIVCTFTNTRRVTDLSIQKTATPNPALASDLVQFTLVVTNSGPAAADGATVGDPAVDGLDCTAAGLPPPTCSATPGSTCPATLTAAALQAGVAIPVLPGAGVVTLGLTCRVTASGF